MEVKEPENVVLGTIGAIVGAIIGSILWILLDQVGFIASIAALAIIFCGIKGYEILGKRISKKGIIISIVITIIIVFLADIFSMGFSIYREFAAEYGISIADAILSVPNFLTEPQILSQFLLNLAIGYVFVVIGCFRFVRRIWHSAE